MPGCAARAIAGLAGIDTRALTLRIRDGGPPNGVLAFPADGRFDIAALQAQAAAWPGLDGHGPGEAGLLHPELRLGRDRVGTGPAATAARPRRATTSSPSITAPSATSCAAWRPAGCRVTVVPATATADDILRHRPDGVFLSNGPGDPAATGEYAVPAIQGVLDAGMPIFGICLGHQLLALALGARTYKLDRGHRGANQPVKELATGKVEITSQNHGFAVDDESLPEGVEVTHVSLFDGSNEGIACADKPRLQRAVPPRGQPRPADSHHLFQRFVAMMEG